jgi:hypothetical protein
MRPDSATKQAIALGEFVETLKGKRIRAIELISWRVGSDFERHSTVRSQSTFLVTGTMWAMSGGHYILHGENDVQYSIGTTKLHTLEIAGGQATATEVYGNEAERRTILQVLEADA